MKFIKNGTSELIHGEGYDKEVLVEKVDLLSNNALVQYIIMKPHSKVVPHYHEKTTEIFYFLEGEGEFNIEGEVVKPKTGDVLVCEVGETHSTDNNSDSQWKYLAFKTHNDKNDLFWV